MFKHLKQNGVSVDSSFGSRGALLGTLNRKNVWKG